MSLFAHCLIGENSINPLYVDCAECYEQGRAAYARLFKENQNPYTNGTLQYEYWESGFQDLPYEEGPLLDE